MIELRWRPFKYGVDYADNGDKIKNAINSPSGDWVILQYRKMQELTGQDNSIGWEWSNWKDTEFEDDYE